jgi:hypothetical protein
MLRREADEFRPDVGWLADLRRSTRTRLSLRLASLGAVAAILTGATLFVVNGSTSITPTPAAAHPIYIALSGYAAPHKGQGVPPALQRHIQCMRHEGFDLPDPLPTRHGWMIKVSHPASLEVRSARWRRAAFVTCALVRDRAVYQRWILRAIMHPRARGGAS